jgi:hypothetical protein
MEASFGEFGDRRGKWEQPLNKAGPNKRPRDGGWGGVKEEGRMRGREGGREGRERREGREGREGRRKGGSERR